MNILKEHNIIHRAIDDIGIGKIKRTINYNLIKLYISFFKYFI